MGTFLNKISKIGLIIFLLIGSVPMASAATMQITGRQVATDTLTATNIADNAITTSEILEGTILHGDISDNAIGYSKIRITGTPTDEYCLSYESTGDFFEWAACAVGSFFDTAGTGLSATGSTVNANAGDSSITMNSDNFSVNAGNGLQTTTDLNVKADAVGGANLATAINVSSNGLAVGIDNSTIGDNGSNRLFVKNAGITETQLATSVAGAGLTGGAGSALAVGAGTGITVNSDNVTVDSTAVLFRADVIANEVPNEACDNATVNFTVDNVVVQTWNFTINGIEQRPTTDYSVAGNTYTLTTACMTGDSLLVDYTK